MIFLNKGSVPKKSGNFSFAIKRRTPTPLMVLLVTNFLSQIGDTTHTLYVGLKRHFFGQLDLGMVSQGKTAVLLDFVQMRGGNPAQIFWHLFISAFLVNKGGYFLQNANNLNFKLFLGCM